MHSRFVRKGIHAHVRLVGGDGHVCGIRNRRRALVNVFQLIGGDALVSALSCKLQMMVERLALPHRSPNPRERPLNLFRPRLHRGDGIGDRQSAVVVAVDGDNGVGKASVTFLVIS